MLYTQKTHSTIHVTVLKGYNIRGRAPVSVSLKAYLLLFADLRTRDTVFHRSVAIGNRGRVLWIGNLRVTALKLLIAAYARPAVDIEQAFTIIAAYVYCMYRLIREYVLRTLRTGLTITISIIQYAQWHCIAYSYVYAYRHVHCVRKKTKTFFCNIFYKTRAILVKFGT